MRHGDVDAETNRRGVDPARLVLVSSLQIIRECMTEEIARRFPKITFAYASHVYEVLRMTLAPSDVVFVDATHEDADFDLRRMLSDLAGLRAIVLRPEGVFDTLGTRQSPRPASLAALMALIGEACRVDGSQSGGDHQPRDLNWRDLTPREREVALGLLAGQSNKAIANELGLSDNTVKMHLTQIMRKLHVTNRTQVVLLLGAGRDVQHASSNGEAREARSRPAGSGMFDEDPAQQSPSYSCA